MRILPRCKRVWAIVPSQRRAWLNMAMQTHRCVALICVLLALAPQPRMSAAEYFEQDIGGCPDFPANNIWNTRVDRLPVDPRSNDYIASIGADIGLHPDFGSGTWDGGPIGIPYTTVVAGQPPVPITFDEFGDESDPGPYPIPPSAPVEWGSDHHVLVVDTSRCVLYELYHATKDASGSGWSAGSGAVFTLTSHLLRPAGWTSADAAGLPIFPGLVRYDEVATGEIRHAIRFSASQTQRKYVWPARHFASSHTDPRLPPMGQRFRLKASKDITGYAAQIQVIFTALMRYGLILADNGSNWYISGSPDPHWDDDVLVTAFRSLKGEDFEAVDVTSLMLNSSSGQVNVSLSPRVFVPSIWHTASAR